MTTTEAIRSVIRSECKNFAPRTLQDEVRTLVLGNKSASGLEVLAMRVCGCAHPRLTQHGWWVW